MTLDVHYITMAFPAPAETFASQDVKELQRQGAAVTVHAMRGRHRAHERLMAERGLDLRTTHSGAGAVLRGSWEAVRRPVVTLEALSFLARSSLRRPVHGLKGLVLLPRALGIYAEIARCRPAVVHLFWGHFPSLVGHLVQRFQPHIVLSTFLGAYDLETGFAGSAEVARRADLVWTHAAVNLDAIAALGVPRAAVRLAYRGVDLRALPAAVEKVPGRVVTAGRLKRSKGMDRVLRAFAQVARARDDLHLVVLGDGPERPALERLAARLGISDRVEFRGHVPHGAVLESMAAAEVFVFLSHKSSERLPNVVKEAIGCRCLCVVSRTPGIEELVEDGVHGFVVDPDDTAAAADRLGRALLDEELRQRLTAAAYRHLEAEFDLAANMARYLRAWQEAAAAKAPSLAPRAGLPTAR